MESLWELLLKHIIISPCFLATTVEFSPLSRLSCWPVMRPVQRAKDFGPVLLDLLDQIREVGLLVLAMFRYSSYGTTCKVGTTAKTIAQII